MCISIVSRVRIIFGLFILMGGSWTMEIVSFLAGGVAYIWIPTDVINILTGIFIFAVFVCKSSVLKLLNDKYVARIARCTSGHGRIKSTYSHDLNPSLSFEDGGYQLHRKTSTTSNCSLIDQSGSQCTDGVLVGDCSADNPHS